MRRIQEECHRRPSEEGRPLVRRVGTGSSHLRVIPAMTDDLLTSLYRFRYSVFVEELGWLPPTTDRLLYDDFDAVAWNYVALADSGEVVGSVRVVPDTLGILPLERCSPLDGFREGKRVVELCRLALHPSLRRSRAAAFLMKAGYERALIGGATHVVLDTYDGSGALPKHYGHMGFAKIAGPYSDPTYRCPLPVSCFALDLTSAAAEWATKRPGLYRFFTRPSEVISHVVGYSDRYAAAIGSRVGSGTLNSK